MRWFSVGVGTIASIVTILAYLQLEPPWVSQHLPHVTWPGGLFQSERPRGNTTDFYSAYTLGVRAAHQHDYSEAVSNYQAAIDAPNAGSAQKARAYDAMGYAYLREGDYDDADKALAAALLIDPRRVTARVNQIKVLCGRAAKPQEVAASLESLRAFVSNDPHGQATVETDSELFRLCGYAGVRSAA